MAEVVERLVREAAGHGTVAEHGDHAAVVHVELVERGGDPERVAGARGRVGVLDPVVFGLGPAGVAREAAGLAEVFEAGLAAREDLVHVRLVAGVEEQHVVG